jgi:Helix-turn-helix domain of resolvase
MQSHHGMELVAEPQQDFEKRYANAADVFALRSEQSLPLISLCKRFSSARGRRQPLGRISDHVVRKMLAKSSSWLVGIAKAKSEGKYKGRAPTARAKADKVKQLKAAGVGPSHIARQLGISRTSVFRILTA